MGCLVEVSFHRKLLVSEAQRIASLLANTAEGAGILWGRGGVIGCVCPQEDLPYIHRLLERGIVRSTRVIRT